MTLQEIELKSSYDSEEDDIITSFYNPVLSQSIKYYRLAGFFSSSTLAVAARGLSSFILNGGRMKLVTGVKLSKSDIDAIRQGIENPEKIINSILIKDLNSLENEFIRDHVRALGWMIANNMLEIKVALVTDKGGFPLNEEEVEKKGIFHPKVGIFEDKEGNVISFSGSVNESAMGWQENIEEFKVFRSWINEEIEYLKADRNKFDKYWYGQTKQVKVLDIPKAVREKFIQIAPENFDELKLIKNRPQKVINLREYQIEAVNSWFKNNKKGLFEMATGTGKTFTALACLKELKKVCKSFAIVIVCPFQHLIFDPWIRHLKEFGFDDIPIITAFGTFRDWKDELMNEVFHINNGLSDNFIVVTTYDTFSSEFFIEIINKIKIPILLIADEVHGVGSEERRNGLIEKYSFRIGLSATPKRWLDDEGSTVINNYFDKVVFEFPLDKAIREGFLTPYEYYPHFVEMTQEEFYEYEKISKKISVQYFKTKDSNEKQKLYELLLFKRSNIIKNSANKMLEFENILNHMNDIKNCLVYCSSYKQMEMAQDILNKRAIINSSFTQRENSDQRQKLLKNFDEGKYGVLVAVNCLDEGVDVPSIKTAIILASSGNPKQFIQRRGRILRKSLGKERAIIHDIIVVPPFEKNISLECLELERRILTKEFRRYKEFSNLALNYLESFNNAYPIIKKYSINLGDT